MPRDINTATNTAAGAEIVRTAGLVELDFSSGFVRVASAPYDISFDSDGDTIDETFIGIGDLGKVSTVEESADQQGYSVQFDLSGVPSSMVSLTLNEHYQGRDAKLWLALLDEQNVISGDPVLLFSGLMDTMDMEVGSEARITVTANSRLVRWEQARNERYNHAAQQARFSGDKGLEFMEAMVEKEIIWPKG